MRKRIKNEKQRRVNDWVKKIEWIKRKKQIIGGKNDWLKEIKKKMFTIKEIPIFNILMALT